jgi:N-acetyl sugar amidotransferase
MNLQTCTKCVYDTSVANITFDSEGICNYCRSYENLASKYINIPSEQRKKEFDFVINKIKRTGKGKKYDCILGLSGGVDSSYMAYLAKENGLRPLVVHFDNGWNSELAVKNIENIITLLDFDLYSYVINWQEFRELQLAYLKSSVVDIEVPTDYLITAILYKIAAEKNIKFILSGYNYVTEFGLPKTWAYTTKTDDTNLRNIYKKFGHLKLKEFPHISQYKRFYYKEILGIESVELLNKIHFVKNDVKKILIDKLNWKDYGGKHYESVFTRFYQGYILPKKFGIDKRKAHWSSLIRSGQATRNEAIEDLKMPPYPIEQQNEDKIYVSKKFGYTVEEFDEIMKAKPIDHSFYGQENPSAFAFKLLKAILYVPIRILRKIRFMKATGKWKFTS